MNDFPSPGKFAAHLMNLVAEGELVTHHITENIVADIAQNARDRIGRYQESEGYFPKWERLKDSTEQEKKRLGYPADAPLLREGDLRDSITHTSLGNQGAVGSDSPIAAYHEYGTVNMAARPFIGPAAFTSEDRDAPKAQLTLAAWISGARWKNLIRK